MYLFAVWAFERFSLLMSNKLALHQQYRKLQESNRTHRKTNLVYTTLCRIIHSVTWELLSFRFSDVRFVYGKELLESGLPVTPEEFESRVKEQCSKTREFLKKTWVLFDVFYAWTIFFLFLSLSLPILLSPLLSSALLLTKQVH